MTTTISQVRDILARTVETVGLRAVAYLSDTIAAPCAHVFVKGFDPRLVFSSSKAVYPFGVTVYTNRTADRSSQTTLDTYRDLSGRQSITVAVQNGDNWPTGLVDYAQVTNISEVRTVEIAGGAYLIIEFDIDILW